MIRWTPDEVKTLAKAFLEARIKDMFAPVSMLLEEAEKVLPEHRRRGVKALTLLSFDAQQEIKNLAKDFGRRYFEPTAVASERPTPETRVEVEMPPVKPAKEDPAPREPFVIEFRIPKSEKPDLAKLLADVPTPVLYGFALDRIMRSGIGLPTFASQSKAPDVVRVEAEAPAPEPVVIKKDEVVDPTPADDGRKRVLVLGLLPSTQAVAKEKSKNFLGLDVTFCDANTRSLPAVIVDYAILMKGIVNVFQAEQIRKRFATKDRVIHCDLGLDDVMSKLADINSRP